MTDEKWGCVTSMNKIWQTENSKSRIMTYWHLSCAITVKHINVVFFVYLTTVNANHTSKFSFPVKMKEKTLHQL